MGDALFNAFIHGKDLNSGNMVYPETIDITLSCGVTYFDILKHLGGFNILLHQSHQPRTF